MDDLNEGLASFVIQGEGSPDHKLVGCNFGALQEGALFELNGLRLIKNIEMNEGGNATLFDNPRQSIRIEADAIVKPL